MAIAVLCLVANVAWADEWEDDAEYRHYRNQRDKRIEQQERNEYRKQQEHYRIQENLDRQQELWLQRDMLEEMKKANKRARDEDGRLSFE